MASTEVHAHDRGATLSSFLRHLLTPYYRNPGGWNIDSVLTLVGVGVWAICAIGESYHVAIMPQYVAQVGSMMFGAGIGRASKTPPPQHKETPRDH